MGLADVDKLAEFAHKLIDAIGFSSEKAAELHAEVPEPVAPEPEPAQELPPAPEPPLAELPPEPVPTPAPEPDPSVPGVDPSGGGVPFGTESDPSG